MISCYCATYGRPWALEEALESFLRQDYTQAKELVILNDYAGHTLHFDHPEVKIFNVNKHIIPLGKKFNETVALCDGEILIPWEDDDIYLPNKISTSVRYMKNGLFHTMQGYYDKNGYLTVAANHFHCNLAFSRNLWKTCGGYAERDRCDIDVEFMAKLLAASPEGRQQIPQEEVFYVYRWGTSGSYHASGWGIAPNVQASLGAEEIVRQQGKKIPVGDYWLKPFWKFDYSDLAVKAVCTRQN